MKVALKIYQLVSQRSQSHGATIFIRQEEPPEGGGTVLQAMEAHDADAPDDGNEFHCQQLHRVCRLYANPLRKSGCGRRSTVCQCSTKRDLLRPLGIDIEHDDASIHPQHICNSCNTKRTFQWTVHSDTDSDCTVCQHFYTLRAGGTPKSSIRGRPPTVIDSLLSLAHPSGRNSHWTGLMPHNTTSPSQTYSARSASA